MCVPLPADADVPSLSFILQPGWRYLAFNGAPGLILLGPTGPPLVSRSSTLASCAGACRSNPPCKAFQLVLQTLTEDTSLRAGDCYFYNKVFPTNDPDSANVVSDSRTILGWDRVKSE